MNKTRYSIVFIFLLLFGGLFSCATTPKANRALYQLHIGNHQKSWQMISEELKHPAVSSPEDLCELHLATIQILQFIVTHDFAPDDPDRVVKKSYDYVCANCQAFNKKFRAAENQYGNYLANTRRPGLAFPITRKP